MENRDCFMIPDSFLNALVVDDWVGLAEDNTCEDLLVKLVLIEGEEEDKMEEKELVALVDAAFMLETLVLIAEADVEVILLTWPVGVFSSADLVEGVTEEEAWALTFIVL